MIKTKPTAIHSKKSLIYRLVVKKKENVFCYKLKQLETFYELAILNFILIGLAGQRCSTTDSVGTNNPAAKSDDLDTDTGETDIVLSSMYSY